MSDMTESMMLTPGVIRENGKPKYAVIPWAELVRLQEMLEDAGDLLALRIAKIEDAGQPSMTLEEAMRAFADADVGTSDQPTVDRT